MKLMDLLREVGETEMANIEKSRGEKIRLGQKQKDLTRQKKMYKGNPEQRARLGKQVSDIQGKKSDLTLKILGDKQRLDTQKKARKLK